MLSVVSHTENWFMSQFQMNMTFLVSNVTVLPVDKKDSVVLQCGPEVYFWIKDFSYCALSFAPTCCKFVWPKKKLKSQICHYSRFSMQISAV